MEILQLRYFCHAAKTENFSHTANTFNVPPSNISQSIKRLERELGAMLFDRSCNRVILNGYGAKFYTKISEALALIDSAANEISASEKKQILSVCALTNRQLIMQATEKFHTLYPDISVVISHDFTNENEYDLIISDSDFTHRNKLQTLIVTEQIGLAINKKNPLSEKETIRVSDLKNEHFIGLNVQSSMYKTTAKICDSLKFTPNIVIQSPDPYYVRKCIELNLGVAFIPTFSWRGQFSNNVIIKSVGNFERKTFAYTDSLHPKKPVEALLKLLSQ